MPATSISSNASNVMPALFGSGLGLKVRVKVVCVRVEVRVKVGVRVKSEGEVYCKGKGKDNIRVRPVNVIGAIRNHGGGRHGTGFQGKTVSC